MNTNIMLEELFITKANDPNFCCYASDILTTVLGVDVNVYLMLRPIENVFFEYFYSTLMVVGLLPENFISTTFDCCEGKYIVYYTFKRLEQ